MAGSQGTLSRVFLSSCLEVQWKPLIMITFGLALFDNNNRLITLSGGYKKFALFNSIYCYSTTFYMYKKQQNLFKKLT